MKLIASGGKVLLFFMTGIKKATDKSLFSLKQGWKLTPACFFIFYRLSCHDNRMLALAIKQEI